MMKRIISCLAALILLLSAVSCGAKRSFPEVPAEVEKLAHDCLQAFAAGTRAAAKYAYFSNEESRELFLDHDEQQVTDYEIQKVDKLSDELYALTVWTTVNYVPEMPEATVYHFIGKIDGTWYYIFSRDEIPSEMKTGIDFSPYIYPNEDGGLMIWD